MLLGWAQFNFFPPFYFIFSLSHLLRGSKFRSDIKKYIVRGILLKDLICKFLNGLLFFLYCLSVIDLSVEISLKNILSNEKFAFVKIVKNNV